jgi:hypothetical protein
VARRYASEADQLTLRNQFPVGVFGEATRAVDLRLLRMWRTELAPYATHGATRFAFGRAWSSGTQLEPAIELALSAGRKVRIVGQTELLLRKDGHYTSVVAVTSRVEKRSRYHLRGALDHVLLAAAGKANSGHEHLLIDREGKTELVVHAPWSAADAREYLVALVEDLLDGVHGYLLPFDSLEKSLRGATVSKIYGDPTSGLGYGPIDRLDGLAHPTDAVAIAQRRLGPLARRMPAAFEGGSS